MKHIIIAIISILALQVGAGLLASQGQLMVAIVLSIVLGMTLGSLRVLRSSLKGGAGWLVLILSIGLPTYTALVLAEIHDEEVQRALVVGAPETRAEEAKHQLIKRTFRLVGSKALTEYYGWTPRTTLRAADEEQHYYVVPVTSKETFDPSKDTVHVWLGFIAELSRKEDRNLKEIREAVFDSLHREPLAGTINYNRSEIYQFRNAVDSAKALHQLFVAEDAPVLLYLSLPDEQGAAIPGKLVLVSLVSYMVLALTGFIATKKQSA